jgi:hypothetical protein
MGFPKGITKLTSTGATVTITHPSGPTTNLEVSVTAEGITALTGDVTATGPGSSAATLVSTAAVKAIIDAEIAAEVIPANGYGITGNTGLTPTPAVTLTSASSFIGGPVTITGATPVNVTSLALAVGTWLLMGQATIDNTVAAVPIVAALGIGATTASFTGALTGAEILLGGSTAVTAHFASISCSCVIVVAAPTTYFLVANLGNAAATGSVLAADNVGNLSGLIAVRIA